MVSYLSPLPPGGSKLFIADSRFTCLFSHKHALIIMLALGGSAQGIAVEYHSPSFLFAAQLFNVTYFISFVETFYIYQHSAIVLLGKKNGTEKSEHFRCTLGGKQ